MAPHQCQPVAVALADIFCVTAVTVKFHLVDSLSNLSIQKCKSIAVVNTSYNLSDVMQVLHHHHHNNAETGRHHSPFNKTMYHQHNSEALILRKKRRRLHTSHLCLLVGLPGTTAHIPQDSETLSLDLFQGEIGRLMGEVTFWKRSRRKGAPLFG